MKRRFSWPARIALGLVAAVVLAPLVAYLLVAQPFVRAATVERVPVVDEARLAHDVRKLSTELHPRTTGHPERLDPVAAFIAKDLSLHAKVTEQTFAVNGRTFRNVIASFGPDTADRVVVGAHYDAAPLAGSANPGADDNASGVAGLLELARHLPHVQLGTRVELVAYSLEEPPFYATESMGSVTHARALRAQGRPIRGMLSLEMIGYFSDAPDSQHFPFQGMGLAYPTTGNFIALVGRPEDKPLLARVKGVMRGATPLPVESLAAPAVVQGIDWSDHRSYWAEGYPAIMVTDTSYLRNERYHTARDTPDTLDYVRMAKVVQATWAAVVDLAR